MPEDERFARGRRGPGVLGFFARNMAAAIFLRAERRADGTRPFSLVEGEPLETSYGVDLYNEIIATSSEEAAVVPLMEAR